MPCSTNHLLWKKFRSLLVAEVYLPSLALCKSVPSNDFKHLACKTMAPHQKTSKPPLLDPRWLVSFNLPVVASINSRCRPAVRWSTSFWLERLELESGCILRHPHSPIHTLPKIEISNPRPKLEHCQISSNLRKVPNKSQGITSFKRCQVWYPTKQPKLWIIILSDNHGKKMCQGKNSNSPSTCTTETMTHLNHFPPGTFVSCITICWPVFCTPPAVRLAVPWGVAASRPGLQRPIPCVAFAPGEAR